MKLPSGRVSAFLASPDPAIRAALLFGPDLGMVREGAGQLVRSVAGHPPDPFRAIELPAATIKAEPARLVDETLTLAFGGGRRVIRVRDGSDAITAAVGTMLAADGGDTLVVIDAGDLPKTSSLRQLFERNPACAAIPCYPDEGPTLDRLIVQELGRHGMNVEPEARHALTSMLGEDRGETLRQLEVLALYVARPGPVTLADVRAALGDNGSGTLEDMIDGAFDGDGRALVRGFAAAEGAGIDAIAMLRFASLHAQRLWSARCLTEAGTSADDALRRLRPPVFFKRQAAFRRHLAAWTSANLASALDHLCAAERSCKTTGAPARPIAERTLMELALLPRPGPNA